MAPGRTLNGQILSAERCTDEALAAVQAAMMQAERENNHKNWCRAKAILGYAQGQSVVALAEQLEVDRKSVTRWLWAYEERGTAGLVRGHGPGVPSRLTDEQREILADVIERGPEAAGFPSGVWTGARVAHWIEQNFGVKYSAKYLPQLLHALDFSVQRPRKLLARANPEQQADWEQNRLPALKKSSRRKRRSAVRG